MTVHTKRPNPMSSGTPEDVRMLVLKENETLKMDEVGA